MAFTTRIYIDGRFVATRMPDGTELNKVTSYSDPPKDTSTERDPTTDTKGHHRLSAHLYIPHHRASITCHVQSSPAATYRKPPFSSLDASQFGAV